MLQTIRRGFFPNAVFAFAHEDEKTDIPLLAGRKTINGKTTAYVCRRGTCLAPVNSPEALAELLNYE
ncbi:MAG: hypothetical protein A3K09_05620 [Nitrospinae bacterium RIFCSPLOWO2_12_FULL_47_7]|nr:MAG: hypothetical protein A3K09_05620 [Nitrospinae bacterium RIFCSPLOWO2_12_FULL_47_7]